MSGTGNKRQQARNERILQDLIKTVPGNNICADCQVRNPGWASWSLGIFLCMRCAAVHRKLGTHISKVKSLSMDSWSNEQVETMKRIGNITSNRIHNPQNTKPPMPLDVEEADAAIERFIRQKYQEKTLKAPSRNITGSSNSDDQPPPLPPKPGGRFGFRSASSIFPLSSKHKKETARHNLEVSQQRSPPRLRNKPSRIFGASVGSEGDDDLGSKIAKLHGMGFPDERRNLAVLKGLSGNLEKSIETLVRLGEGGAAAGESEPGEIARLPPRVSSRAASSAITDLSVNGVQDESSPMSSKNPFDTLDVTLPVLPPQSSQSTGQMGNHYQPATLNPFGFTPSQSQYNLNQAFQNMSVNTSQPLFPNHTGPGFPGPQPSQAQLYQQSLTPPVPHLSQHYYSSVIYENSAQQPQYTSSHNPFLQHTQQTPTLSTTTQSNHQTQHLTPQTLYQRPAQKSPEQRLPLALFDYSVQQPQQQQSNMFTTPNSSQQQANTYTDQLNLQIASQQSIDYQAQHNQQSCQPTPSLMPQQTGRVDKHGILDLYNHPELAPIRPSHADSSHGPHVANSGSTASKLQQQSGSIPIPTSPITSATSRNPFYSGMPSSASEVVGSAVPVLNGTRHVSQESVNLDFGGWMNGRHSPDAWGSISARSMR